MKLRVIERFDTQGNPFYAIQKRYFWCFWGGGGGGGGGDSYQWDTYESVDDAIEQVKNYMKQYNRLKNPRVFYSCED